MNRVRSGTTEGFELGQKFPGRYSQNVGTQGANFIFLESSLVDGASKTLQVLEIAPDHFVPNTSELSLEL